MAINKLDKVYYPPPVQKTQDEQFREGAEMYEKLFIKEMVKAMRSTVPESGLIQQSNGEKIFRDELDNEYVDQWTKKGGVGIADMIFEQLQQKYGGHNQKIKPSGPLSAKDIEIFKGSRAMNQKSDQTAFVLSRGDSQGQAGKRSVVGIQSPYDGILKEKMAVSDGYLMRIDHDNGLSSKIHFRGTADSLEKGQKIQAGQRIGLLSPEANEFFWSLSGRMDKASEEVGGPASL